MSDYVVGQRVVVQDAMRNRAHRGVVVAVLADDGIRSSAACAATVHIVRWVDELGRAHETHRYADELSPAAQVLGDTARIVWAARRAGARLAEDKVRHGIRRRRWVAAGIGVDLIVTTEARS